MSRLDDYHQVLLELGLLTDEDDWDLYQAQEKLYEIDSEAFFKYSTLAPREIPS